MTRERLRSHDPKTVRDSLNDAIDKAESIHHLENELVMALQKIDAKRFYVRSGQKSLRGFCNRVLNFSETQSQRIVTLVRRYEPTPNIGHKKDQVESLEA